MASFIAGVAACVLLIAISILLLDISDVTNIDTYDLPGVHVSDRNT